MATYIKLLDKNPESTIGTMLRCSIGASPLEEGFEGVYCLQI